MLGDIATGARFVASLPPFFSRSINADEARSVLRRRLERRDDDFLALIRRAIYEQPDSPYRALLRAAGCECGDLEGLVRREGVEDALRVLLRAGVYLTGDELKGRRPVVRGSLTLAVTPVKLRNPLTIPHFKANRGNEARSVAIDLANIRDHAINLCLALDARGGLGWEHALWGVPGSVTLDHVLRFALLAKTVRWFSPVDPSSSQLSPSYRWSARLMRWAAAITGVSIPAPEVVPPESPLPILEWIESVLRARRTPHLWTYASAAVRVCRAAREVGIDISGTRMTMSGEPITAARVSAVREAGAVPIPRCGVTETGSFGFSCIAPAAPDDMHVMHDLVAVIQPGSEAVDQLPGDALLLSSLRPAARLILINVSAGDQATLEHRVCGCRMETLGWRIHVYTLRSFEKLTAAGMTFLDADVIRVLEEVLPARFGGGPTDYQLVDEESHEGRANLRLLVDPRVGPLDDAAVADTFLASIGGGSGAQRVMELQWRQAGVVSIERRPPLPTASGKILHLVRTGQPSVG